jgi:hypothetical protein
LKNVSYIFYKIAIQRNNRYVSVLLCCLQPSILRICWIKFELHIYSDDSLDCYQLHFWITNQNKTLLKNHSSSKFEKINMQWWQIGSKLIKKKYIYLFDSLSNAILFFEKNQRFLFNPFVHHFFLAEEKNKFPQLCFSFELIESEKNAKKNRKMFPHPDIFNVLHRGHVPSKNKKRKKINMIYLIFNKKTYHSLKR